ncbi:sialate O-acetylesterase [Arachidicoccus rhizosphaerae]|uniref:Sialate O-acetylesterase n=1 Tax=Arachidicoccus rhizosphaerae TaxID=551991 RepID=A0A1H3ZM80_9BACT|nr:GDSL-type esterase/lipase family protein [Arachidicoccus rhizosphaerae]SEA24511.1 sialate O-acetylesterase [Arachidicoccus rhizosphaerae]
MRFFNTIRIHPYLCRFMAAVPGAFFFLCTSGLFAQPVRVACVGNSVTYGYSLKDPATQSYPAVLQGLLGSSYTVGNFGHSGATLLKNGHRPYYKTKEFQGALAMHPDIVVIHLGLNDTDPRDFALYGDHFIPDYNWLIDTFRQVNPKARIYICKMTPIFTGHPRFLSSTHVWYQKVQQAIEQVARINKVPLIDLYQQFHDRPDLITDQPTLHPNKAGAAKLAKVIYQHLTGRFGGLTLPDIFTSGMVLQRDQPVKIWGTADAGSTVLVKFHGQEKKCTVPFDGRWQLQLAAQKANAQPETMTVINGSDKIQLQDILIGDVWLASGQSNMLFTVKQTDKADSLIRHRELKKGILRLFNDKNLAATDDINWDTAVLNKTDRLQFFSGHWAKPDPEETSDFSAVGYVFGRQIALSQDIPVGMIEVAVGGSPLLSWVDRSTLENDPLFEPALHDWLHSDYLMEWCRQRAAKNLEKSTAPYPRHPYEPAYNYEAGIAPIAGLPIKGVIWYQGESDADNAPLFARLFPVFVKSWRATWHRADLPFYYVQLSSLDRPSWNYFRDVQRKLQHQIPHSKMVVTSDLGDSLNVHYKDKIPVGQRLALVALKETYHQDIEDQGPTIEKATRLKSQQLLLQFSHADGLRAKGGAPLRGFKIFDQNGNLVDVPGKIQGSSVVLQLPLHTQATSVVYGWEGFTRANLINKAALPASSFKLDLPPLP